MIQLGNNSYRVCLLDTNIIRSTLEMSQGIHENLLLKLKDNTIFAFDLITLVELSHKPELIEKFIQFMKSIPVLFLKADHSICDLERERGVKGLSIDDIIFGVSNPQEPESGKEVIEFLHSDGFIEISNVLKSDQTMVYNRMLKDFEDASKITLSAKDYTIAKIFHLFPDVTFDDKALLSQKVINLVIYYKYIIRRKKPSRSDTFDFLITSAVPYVDVYITENDQAKSFGQIKRHHEFLANTEILTMADLRKESSRNIN